MNWHNESITRKIGGLSTVLLSFILIVILYSIIKLLEIGQEMREVARVDIPLTEVLAEVEILQLEQHLLMEQVQLHQIKQNPQVNFEMLKSNFQSFSKKLDSELSRAISLISNGLESGQISQQINEHRQALEDIKAYQAQHKVFQQDAGKILLSSIDGDTELANWRSLEAQDSALDKVAITLLKRIETLTEDIAKNAEKHEREFLAINTALGVTAFFTGIYLTTYIISSFRKRVSSIHGKIESLQESITKQEPLSIFDKAALEEAAGADELTDLANDINQVMSKYSEQMTNRYQLEDQLIQLATTDKLTGAFNRHKWDDCLVNELENAKRNGAISLLMFDVDFFKKVNDKYGHDVGDKVLIHLSELVKQHIRKADKLFRLGGEEFAIIARDLDVIQASTMADKLRGVIEQTLEDGLPKFTVSFGVTQFLKDDDVDSVFKRVDQALYASKNAGRNTVTTL